MEESRRRLESYESRFEVPVMQGHRRVEIIVNERYGGVTVRGAAMVVATTPWNDGRVGERPIVRPGEEPDEIYVCVELGIEKVEITLDRRGHKPWWRGLMNTMRLAINAMAFDKGTQVTLWHGSRQYYSAVAPRDGEEFLHPAPPPEAGPAESAASSEAAH